MTEDSPFFMVIIKVAGQDFPNNPRPMPNFFNPSIHHYKIVKFAIFDSQILILAYVGERIGPLRYSPYVQEQLTWCRGPSALKVEDGASSGVRWRYRGFHGHGGTPKTLDGLCRGKFQSKMDDDSGYPHDETETSIFHV